MIITAKADMQRELERILAENPTVLFAGAGVSSHAHMPNWTSYLEHLASIAQKYEPPAAELIRRRLAAKKFLEAAAYYKTCSEIPQGEKLKELAAPFAESAFDSTRLDGLCSLPFQAAITPNYDRALHHSFSRTRGSAPLQADLKDPTMRECLFWKDFYIARIHGRAEVPSSIVLDTADYAALNEDSDYQDFLRSALVRHSLLFIGFSFLDPAINQVLEFIRRTGVQPALHHALVPAGNPELSTTLASFNIEIIEYDPRDDHAVLWDALPGAARAVSTGSATRTSSAGATFATAKRLLATCYARASMGKEVQALRSVVIEGIILSELSAGIGSINDLSARLRSYIALTEREATEMVDANVDHLVQKGICLRDADTVILVHDVGKQESPVFSLVEGVVARALLRGASPATVDLKESLCSVIEEVIVLRGFDLGAEFAGANIDDEPDLSMTFSAALERHFPHEWQDKKQLLSESFSDLVRHPSRKEETILGELGRLAFGIEILLESGRSAVYGYTLPQVIYLDSNVLMPAIVLGHPNRTAYGSAIRKLQEAAQKSGGQFSVHISDVILNEIVNHRRKSIEIVRDGQLEDIPTLERRILYFGAGNVNVYVGGFAGWTREKANRSKTFKEFLAETAPYNSESELRQYLASIGITVSNTRFTEASEIVEQENIQDSLYEGYEAQERGLPSAERKIDLLKRHEAAQLYLLQRDSMVGRRTIFVTADTKLRKAVAYSSLAGLRDSLMSPQNLIQLVDLVIGMDVPPSSLARLLWSVKMADDRAAIKDYLVHRALPYYDAALLLKLNDVLDRYADQIVKNAELEKISLAPFSFEDRLSTSRFMDRSEDEAFVSLADEVLKLKRKMRDAGIE